MQKKSVFWTKKKKSNILTKTDFFENVLISILQDKI